MKIPDYNKKIKHPTYLKMQEEIKRLKEEYVMLQNASDEVEEAKDREIERLNSIIKEQDKELELERKSRQLLTDDLVNVCKISLKKDNIIKEVREYRKGNQEEHKYTDRGGFTYTEGHFLRDSDTLLEILDKANKEE